MNPHIAQLYHLAQKKERLILGTMSGTSLDGLDLALVSFQGHGAQTQYTLQAVDSHPFDASTKAQIRAVFAKEQIDFKALCRLNAQLARTHAALILKSLSHWGVDPNAVDVLASHGQTVMHCPSRDGKEPHSTLQIVDGDHLAHLTGIITLSDFRQKQVAAGAEGAPLAVFGDYFLFSKPGTDRILLNLGGIGNFSYLPADAQAAAVFVSDTGPANTLMDACMRKFFHEAYDKDGAKASKGKVDSPFLNSLQQHPFFKRPFPKSTGPEDFHWNWVMECLADRPLAPEDILRTLVELTAWSVGEALATCLPSPSPKNMELIASGGGSLNPCLMQALASQLPSSMQLLPSEALGIPAAYKEALLFAVLANESLADPHAGPPTMLGKSPWLRLGKISFPT